MSRVRFDIMIAHSMWIQWNDFATNFLAEFGLIFEAQTRQYGHEVFQARSNQS